MMFENLYTAPYPYPFVNQQQFSQQQTQAQKVPIVSGENGVRADALAPDSSKLYLDESGAKLWVAVTNNLGVKTVSCFDIIPHEEKPAPDYSDIEQRLAKLEERFNGYSETSRRSDRAEQRTGNQHRANQAVSEQPKRDEQS